MLLTASRSKVKSVSGRFGDVLIGHESISADRILQSNGDGTIGDAGFSVADLQTTFATLVPGIANNLAILDGTGQLIDSGVHTGTAAGTIPVLGTGGKLAAAMLPDLAISDFLGTVASQAAMLSLVGQRGDWAIRTDTVGGSSSWVLITDDPTNIANWKQLVTPDTGVTSIAGTANQVTLSAATGNVVASLPATINVNTTGTAANVSGTVLTSHGGSGLTATPANGQLLIGNATGFTLATLTGTANQVLIANTAGAVTLSTPQNIGTASAPSFAAITASSGDIKASDNSKFIRLGSSTTGWQLGYDGTSGSTLFLRDGDGGDCGLDCRVAYVVFFGIDVFNGGPYCANVGGNLLISSDASTPDRSVACFQAILTGGLDTGGVITSGALPTVAIVSGTGTQISTTRDVDLKVPITFNSTVSLAATCTVQLSPNNITYSTLVTKTYPVGVALAGSVDEVNLRVPRGWYVKLTVAQAVIGTGTYY